MNVFNTLLEDCDSTYSLGVFSGPEKAQQAFQQYMGEQWPSLIVMNEWKIDSIIHNTSTRYYDAMNGIPYTFSIIEMPIDELIA